MSSHTSELKAALPANFSGKNDGTTQWIKAMKAYFVQNSTLYTIDTTKIMTTLNKMSSGRGAPYTETWYDKMADTSIANSEKTFEKFTQDFETTFYPFDTKVTTCTELSTLVQTSFKEKDSTPNNGFQQYIIDFQNLSLKARIKEEFHLIDQFSLGLDQKITSMILSMATIPTTVKGWIDQAKIFHAQKMCILALQKGQIAPQVHLSSRPQQDPNAMGVGAITLSKLTPVKLAKCIKEGQCFRCRKTGHNTRNCHTSSHSQSSPSPSHPQHVRTTNTQPEPSRNRFTPALHSALNEYVNLLKTPEKSELDILEVLTTCYKEPSEEIMEISTPGALDL